MVAYSQAKEFALSQNSSFDTVRDLGIGWVFEDSKRGEDTPFYMIKKDGELVTDILDFLEEYMLLPEKTDIPLKFESGEPITK